MLSSHFISLLHSVSSQYSKPGKTCGSHLMLVNQDGLGKCLGMNKYTVSCKINNNAVWKFEIFISLIACVDNPF